MPQLRDSWEKKLKARADRASVLAAQAEVDEEIRRVKRVRAHPEPFGTRAGCACPRDRARLRPTRRGRRGRVLTRPAHVAQADRELREAREKKKEENKARGLQYQIITDSRKLKRMSKKQLRQVKKADTTGGTIKLQSAGVRKGK